MSVRRMMFIPALVVLLAASACAEAPLTDTTGGNEPSTAPAPEEEPVAEFPDVWKYGTIQAMTGFGAYWGDKQSKSHRLAVEQLNESGEFPFEIEVIVGDHKSDDATAALNEAQKMVDIDGIRWFNSSWVASTLAVNPILSQNNIPEINAVGTGNGLLGHPGLWNLRLQLNQTVPYLVQFVAENYDINRAAFVWWADAHAAIGELSVKVAEDLGIEATVAEAFEPGTTDFRSLLAKIAQTDPDAIFIWAFGEDIGNFVRQADEIGLRDSVVIGSNVMEPRAYEIAGEAMEGIIYADDRYWSELDTAMNKEFVDAYSERWDIPREEIEVYEALEYESAMNVMRPVLRYLLDNGRDPFNSEELLRAIEEIKNFPTILSDDALMELRSDGSVVKPLQVYRGGSTFTEVEFLAEILDAVPVSMP